MHDLYYIDVYVIGYQIFHFNTSRERAYHRRRRRSGLP